MKITYKYPNHVIRIMHLEENTTLKKLIDIITIDIITCNQRIKKFDGNIHISWNKEEENISPNENLNPLKYDKVSEGGL